MSSKTEVDDYLAEGHTIAEVLQLSSAELKPLASVRPSSQATRLLQLAADLGLELFHSPDGRAFVSFEVESHRETWPVRSSTFSTWMRRMFYLREHSAPGGQAVQDALSVLEAEALFRGPEAAVYVRTAQYDGKIYLDLCDSQWRVVEISTASWRILPRAPMHFCRARGMRPLVEPTRGGSLLDLRRFVNVESDADFVLLLASLLGSLRPQGPYPILCIIGEQGSAKSTGQRVLRFLVDPNSAALRASPHDARDLMIAVQNGWVIALDNLSRIPEWLSDALCRLATGGGFATRQLYSDDAEALFEAMRPVTLNGIESVIERADLLDRTVLVGFRSIGARSRRTEDEFWGDFSAAAPGILGALLDAVSRALATVEAVRLQALPRMADFAVWAYAALGELAPEFLAAYAGNRLEMSTLSLDGEILAEPLWALAERQWSQGTEWSGTAQQLLDLLGSQVDERVAKQRDWPGNARALSNRLRRLKPSLRAAGLDVQFFRAGKRRTRMISLPRSVAEVGAATTSASSAERLVASPVAVEASAMQRPEPTGRWGCEDLCPPGKPPVDQADGRDTSFAAPVCKPTAMLPGEDWEEFRR